MIGIQYSKALFEISVENKSTLEVAEQLQNIVDIFDANDDLVKLLNSPAVKSDKKNKVIDNIFTKFNNDIVSFLKVVVANGRISNLKEITDNYNKLSSDYDKTVSAVVETKKALTKQEQDLLKSKLEKKLDKKVLMKEIINESLVGGFKVTVDGKFIDVTFDSKIENLKNYL